MKKIKTINFLKKDKTEDKLFTCVVLILIYLLVFQGFSYIKSINLLEDEISNIKLSMNKKEESTLEVKKSTLLGDTKEVYDLLGVSNIQRLYIDNKQVEIEGKCKDLKVLDELEEIKSVNDVSVSSIEKKGSKYFFKVIYQIGGAN
ncbi:MAG: hypothetical protein RSG52_10650 [Terrisporobacter sp.]|uniref:hypothetical protein n=1 Tax=Terrisporobacter sp. TaxID=1965305 RepID=UPI002FCA6F44